MSRLIISLMLIAIITSCSQKQNEMPDNVLDVLVLSGTNRSELEKVIDKYQSKEDVLKLKAAYFLIGNMKDKGYAEFEVSDADNEIIGFRALDYANYNGMTRAWDSIVKVRGKLHQQRIKWIPDYELISSEYLINNINQAFNVWENNPWTKFLSFEQFCEYILPYRSTNEPMEDWRGHFEEKYAWMKDSIQNVGDPVEACAWINSDIKSWFTFDPRFYEHATDLGLTDMVEGKMGRCEDMTNLAIYAMRANGVPVMSDYTPYWAKSGNNHAWNAVLGADEKLNIFMGGEANPGHYKLGQAKAKVYRKTFALQPKSLAAILKEDEKAPKYINRNGIVDVTREYVPVSDVELPLEKDIPEGHRFAYLCVFNTGEWKAIHWSFIGDNKKVKFTDMGKDIAYLPAYFVDGKIIPAGTQFILSDEGKIEVNDPDLTNKITLNLISTTKRVTRETTDHVEEVFLKIGETFELFYWDGEWISLGEEKATGKAMKFTSVPSGAMYWLVNTTPTKDRPERIFTLDKEGKQLWW
ncbi:MAG: transglutaminase domain-containing protein [Bacteroidales bacterium]|nr:transglutaminase domain-containing protein [Bacteroidales bacterium]